MPSSPETVNPRAPSHGHHRNSDLAALSDERLVDLVRRNCEPAFEHIVQRYRQPLVRYCARRFDEHRAEDIVQQALLNAYRAMLRDDRPIQLKPWLFRIAHNLLLNTVSRDAFNYAELDENLDGVPQPPQVFQRRAELRSLTARIAVLPPRQRAALVLHELEGRSYREIASALDVTVPGVRALINRARTGLRGGVAVLVPVGWLRSLIGAARWGVPDPQGTAFLGRSAETACGIAKAGAAALVAGALAAGTVGAPKLTHDGPMRAQPVGSAEPRATRPGPSVPGAHDHAQRRRAPDVAAASVRKRTDRGIKRQGVGGQQPSEADEPLLENGADAEDSQPVMADDEWQPEEVTEEDAGDEETPPADDGADQPDDDPAAEIASETGEDE